MGTDSEVCISTKSTYENPLIRFIHQNYLVSVRKLSCLIYVNP